MNKNKRTIKDDVDFFLWLAFLFLLFWQVVASDFSFKILYKAFGSEEETVEFLPTFSQPKLVIEAGDLIKKHLIKDFSLSKELYDNFLFSETLTAVIYPIRFEKDSSFVLVQKKYDTGFPRKILHKTFSVGSKISEFLPENIIKYNYPLIFSEESSFLLLSKERSDLCNVIDETFNFKLYDCSKKH